MKCGVCGAQLQPVHSDLPFKVSEQTIVILKHLPVLQCENCAQYLLEDRKLVSAMTLTNVDLRVFMRSPNSENEALICVCSPQTDIATVVDRGRSAFDQIVAVG